MLMVAIIDTATAHASDGTHGMRFVAVAPSREIGFQPSAGSYRLVICKVFGTTKAMNADAAIQSALTLRPLPFSPIPCRPTIPRSRSAAVLRLGDRKITIDAATHAKVMRKPPPSMNRALRGLSRHSLGTSIRH